MDLLIKLLYDNNNNNNQNMFFVFFVCFFFLTFNLAAMMEISQQFRSR